MVVVDATGVILSLGEVGFGFGLSDGVLLLGIATMLHRRRKVTARACAGGRTETFGTRVGGGGRNDDDDGGGGGGGRFVCVCLCCVSV